MGTTESGRDYTVRLFADGAALVAVGGEGEIENRDYLELADRVWGDDAGSVRLMAAGDMTDALTNVQSNAYPYANPVLIDDGSMFLYISDNFGADDYDSNKPQSVVSYAVKNGDSYEDKGRVDTVTAESNILADSDVVASGAEDNAFAAWVKQIESPEKEMKDPATYDDLGMMMNATEVYAGVYNDSAWTVERLTDNMVADMSPTVASYGNRAIVAWRSLSATEMPEEDGSDDLTAMFNAENNVNYRIYADGSWQTAQIAYNGAAGTVNAIDSAMLSDGTAILVYSVRTGEDPTTTETFYTVVGTDGNPITTGRLTNDSYTDTNAQVTAVGNQFVLAWYSEHDADKEPVTDYDENGNEIENAVITAHDIRLARIAANGSVDADFPESLGGGGKDINSDFRFSALAGNTALSNLSIVWAMPKDSDAEEDAGKYSI